MGAIIDAVLDTPHRIWLWVNNLKRIRNMMERVSETAVFALVWWATGFSWWGMLFSIAAEWAWFEWLMEPLGFSGYYFERGPREGEEPEHPFGTPGYWEE